MKRIVALTSLLAGAICIVGCSASDDVGSDSANVESSSSCVQNSAAKSFYERALRGAQERLAGDVCSSEEGYLFSIADNATQAVLICPELKETIKSDPAAQPIRDALADSLTLNALTGELLVLRDSEWQNWNGVESLLVGKTFMTEPQGAVGYYSAYKFHADGKATFVGTQEVDSEDGWGVEHPEIVRTGDVRSPRRVIITHDDGQRIEFDLKVSNGWSDQGAPIFQLVRPGQDPGQLWNTYNSLYGECDA
jgi:hypothetical protein